VSTRFVASAHLQLADLGDYSIAAHPFLLQRLVGKPAFVHLLDLFAPDGLTVDEFAERTGLHEHAAAIFDLFERRRFIVPAGADEDELLVDALRLRAGDAAARGPIVAHEGESFYTPAPVSLDSLASRGALRPLAVSLVGGCALEFLKEPLRTAALAHGFDARVAARWASSPEVFARAIAEDAPDLIIYQPGTNSLLAPVWDELPFLSDAETVERVQAMKERVGLFLDALAGDLAGRLALVHNVAAPHLSPLGRTDFRRAHGLSWALREINDFIASKLRGQPNMLLVDEAALAARHGSAALFDDVHFPFSHHGGAADLRVDEPNQRPELSLALAAEYLSLHQLWTGAGRIKAIICDLDGVLWPGLAAESGFSWMSSDKTSTLLHLGIHQALKIAKSRGVLLATCSKNSEETVVEAWRAAARGRRDVLSPDDFALHRINWKRKSDNVQEIIETLGIGADSVLFIDDNAVERAEVAAVQPAVRLLGEDLTQVRAALLSDPALECNHATAESAQRTDMMRAQLARSAARSVDYPAFLKSLSIRMKVAALTPAALDRAHELVQRTNQFNTSLVRYDYETLSGMLRDPAVVAHTLEVEDKFGAYGMVGVIIRVANEVRLFVMSCRVIGLNVAVPFLVTALRQGELPLPVTGTIVEGSRNQPCRGLFADAGFTATGDGRFILRDRAQLAAVDESIYAISREP
jgi:FkbH-like protein